MYVILGGGVPFKPWKTRPARPDPSRIVSRGASASCTRVVSYCAPGLWTPVAPPLCAPVLSPVVLLACELPLCPAPVLSPVVPPACGLQLCVWVGLFEHVDILQIRVRNRVVCLLLWSAQKKKLSHSSSIRSILHPRQPNPPRFSRQMVSSRVEFTLDLEDQLYTCDVGDMRCAFSSDTALYTLDSVQRPLSRL